MELKHRTKNIVIEYIIYGYVCTMKYALCKMHNALHTIPFLSISQWCLNTMWWDGERLCTFNLLKCYTHSHWKLNKDFGFVYPKQWNCRACCLPSNKRQTQLVYIVCALAIWSHSTYNLEYLYYYFIIKVSSSFMFDRNCNFLIWKLKTKRFIIAKVIVCTLSVQQSQSYNCWRIKCFEL